MNQTILLAEDVWKTYGSDTVTLDALRGVNARVSHGEFIALSGPSGCGKSTLLHILGAMDSPSRGSVQLDGCRLDSLDSDGLAAIRRKQIGFVFQSFNLLPTLCVEENIGLPLSLDGVSPREAQVRAAEALAEVGLEARRRHFPSQLSGGEQQRVAIARALAIRPRVIIADEPTGSLDSVNGRRVLELLAELNDTKNITVLMATHSNEACGFASRILYLRDGEVVEESGSGVIPASL